MSRPNILFLLSDEHGFRYMGHMPEENGGEPVHTPTFDRLAAQGTIFTNAYCQMPLCTPSRLCILTGQEVREAGAWYNESVLRPGLITLPQVLAEAGYETCLVGKMHLGGSRQFAGFTHRPYGDLTGHTGHQWEPIEGKGKHTMRERTAHVGLTEIPESLIQDQVVAHETVAFLREHQHARPHKPWFLCASFSRPHFPLTTPRRHFERYWPDSVTEPRVPAAGDAYDHPMSVGMREGFKADDISHDEMMRARAAYCANVSYLDEVIGDLLLRLERDDLLRNTVILYATDHGEMAGEHGVWWKNGWYEACTRVPLIFSLPEQRSAARPSRLCDVPVGLVDIFPTLCTLAGAEAPVGLAGVDLAPVLQGTKEPPQRPIYCDALNPRWGPGTEFRMIRWHQFKYVRFREAPPLFFDLEKDPGEQHNLVERGASGAALGALRQMEKLADETMDFDGAEHERTVRDGSLAQEYAQQLPQSTGNLYLMPSGRLINADDPLYNPTVIAERPEQAFSDMSKEGQQQ
jgi:choline-sulfatase